MAHRADLPSRPDLEHETRLWVSGLRRLAGVDEAGRGAWAGPVVAAAVILPPDDPLLPNRLGGVRDSKQMTARQREHWAVRILDLAQAVGVGAASSEEVDEIGLIAATRRAMRQAIAVLHPAPDHLLIDHLMLRGISIPQTALTHGDALSLSIAAASVIAKVTRDRHMADLELACPGYGFAVHKGYGTRLHQAALARLGPSPAHRRTYAPVALRLNLEPGPAKGIQAG
jgi:ribonuclease HII